MKHINIRQWKSDLITLHDRTTVAEAFRNGPCLKASTMFFELVYSLLHHILLQYKILYMYLYVHYLIQYLQ